MFIRRTSTRRSGEHYFTFRLVRSERSGSKVRQRTLLNLGRHFEVAQSLWPRLCQRIDELLAGQLPCPPEDSTNVVSGKPGAVHDSAAGGEYERRVPPAHAGIDL